VDGSKVLEEAGGCKVEVLEKWIEGDGEAKATDRRHSLATDRRHSLVADQVDDALLLLRPLPQHQTERA